MIMIFEQISFETMKHKKKFKTNFLKVSFNNVIVNKQSCIRFNVISHGYSSPY